MRNSITNNILWCQPDTNRRRATATLLEDGILRFGTGMCEILRTRKIRVGFLQSECALVVEINVESGFKLPKNGSTRISGVIQHLKRLGIEFPASFLFDEETKDTRWKGYIIPPMRKIASKKPKKPTPILDIQSVLNAYKWLIDRVVCSYAKSTPVDERRAMATEAFIEALSEYMPVYGPMKEYLFEKTKNQVIEHNKQFTKNNLYNTISLDAPINKNDDPDISNYNWLWTGFKDEISAAENRFDMDTFKKKHLKLRERKILEMLLTGYTVPEILDDREMEQQDIEAICKSIGIKWNAFNTPNCIPVA